LALTVAGLGGLGVVPVVVVPVVVVPVGVVPVGVVPVGVVPVVVVGPVPPSPTPPPPAPDAIEAAPSPMTRAAAREGRTDRISDMCNPWDGAKLRSWRRRVG
jgi:hypothetical protein